MKKERLCGDFFPMLNRGKVAQFFLETLLVVEGDVFLDGLVGFLKSLWLREVKLLCFQMGEERFDTSIVKAIPTTRMAS